MCTHASYIQACWVIHVRRRRPLILARKVGWARWSTLWASWRSSIQRDHATLFVVSPARIDRQMRVPMCLCDIQELRTTRSAWPASDFPQRGAPNTSWQDDTRPLQLIQVHSRLGFTPPSAISCTDHASPIKASKDVNTYRSIDQQHYWKSVLWQCPGCYLATKHSQTMFPCLLCYQATHLLQILVILLLSRCLEDCDTQQVQCRGRSGKLICMGRW